MSSSQWTVRVPDRSAPFYFDRTLTADEVKSALVSTGHTNVATSEMVINGSEITFRRASGGNKGL